MQAKLILTIGCVLSLTGVLLLAGCDEYHAIEDDRPAPPTQADRPAPPGAEERRSTLGRAMDAGERTRDRADDYHQRVEEEAENIGQP